jgi:hypothetical protein
MHSKLYVLLSVTLLALCSFTNDANEKRISNKLYSFSVPSDWKPFVTDKTDGFVPGERDTRLWHLHYLAWETPVQSDGDFSKVMGINIQSYQRIDGAPISLAELEDIEMSRYKAPDESLSVLDKTELPVKPNQRGYVLKTKEIAIDRGAVTHHISYGVYMLCKGKDIVHCVSIRASESQYLLPETQTIIKDILDSFSVNND